ncbi:MAG: hypothetical protein LBT96_02065 [Campylobacteraceae bacterium]|jgi:hypothetical protein|nr:hypothetical protein [Campylobacteraceae bacterium]
MLNKTHLIDKVNKIHRGDLFANISNDLGAYCKTISVDTEDKLRLMAYAYARRTAAAGLYLQGIFDKSQFAHVQNIFKTLQLTTGRTKEFQIMAAQQARELLLSYDKRLTNEVINVLTSLAVYDQNHEEPCCKDKGITIATEEVLYRAEIAAEALKNKR